MAKETSKYFIICSKIPSLENPGRTVLDDIWDFNYEYPLHNEYRLVVKGKAINCHDMTMDDECKMAMTKFLFIPEKEVEGKTIFHI